MVERANKKLGLERAMNADRGNDGLVDGKDGGTKGPPQDRSEVDAMLKRGAHDIFMNDDDDSAAKKFSEADIDEILQSSSTKVSYENEGGTGSVFSKAAFVADESAEGLDMEDPEFWTKILPELQEQNPELADEFLKRKRKEIKRFGMADMDEVDEYLDEGIRRRSGGSRFGGDDGPRFKRQMLAPHEWSKTERQNAERAMLSFGFGRWGRIKREAGGATSFRSDEEVARFGVLFVCLCCGVPIGSVGGAEGMVEAAAEGIARAKDVLMAFGCPIPTLSASMVRDLEPLVKASGQEYAERVQKLAPTFITRLVTLKRLADAIEREDDPVLTFRAPVVNGGLGREANVPWSSTDDAMLLLGVYKHGYRAYLKIRDDPELTFRCRSDGPAMAPTLTHYAPPGVLVAPVPPVPSMPPPGGYDSFDMLPVPPAGGIRASKQQQKLKAAQADQVHPACFPNEKEFKSRMILLLDALLEQERLRSERDAAEVDWEEEWQREKRGEVTRRVPKAPRLPTAAAAGGAEQTAAPGGGATGRPSFASEVERLSAWRSGGAQPEEPGSWL